MISISILLSVLFLKTLRISSYIKLSLKPDSIVAIPDDFFIIQINICNLYHCIELDLS